MYEGGNELTATWRVSRVTLDRLSAIEVSVVWYTEGKGDQDFQVHHFERLEENEIRRLGLADNHSLICELPATPLSYNGRLIRLRWCVRIRVFLSDGREIVSEHPFYLIAPQTRSPEMSGMSAERRRLRNPKQD